MFTLKGIDLSSHNGKPDFDKIKADNVDFVMIRMGFGGDSPSQDDTEFERNVSECERVGLPWGAYLYSYALNVDDAKGEAEHAKRLLKGKNPKFPIGFDMEDADQNKEKHGMPSNDVLVDICDTFLSGIEDAGYKGILYASLSWLEHQLKDPKLNKYDKWVAQWADICTYTEIYTMWQYADNGKVDGVGTSVDLNYCHFDYVGDSPSPSKPKESIVKKVVKAVEHIIHHDTHYSVAPNDTLSEIAAKFNVSVNDLVKWNNIKDKDMIRVGQMITIKKANQHVSPSHASKKIYVVKSGDSLSKIASDHKMSLAQLEKLNPQIKDFDVISIGEKINLN